MSTKTKTKNKNLHITARPAIPQKRSLRFDPHLIGILLVVLFISILRIQLADVPLERDEGEYAYIGRLLLEGIAPYKMAYNMKLPGTYFMYALLMAIFGKTASGIHYGLILINSATTIFFFLGFRRIFNSSIAFYASGVYAIMSLSPAFLGFAAHATQFVSFFCSVAIYFFSLFMIRKRMLYSFFTGVMFGLAFLMKQQAVFFIVFGGVMIVLSTLSEKPFRYKTVFLHSLLYTVGAILPYALTVLALKLGGAFDKFWFWTVTYASKYASGVSLKVGKQQFSESFQPMWKEFAFFWILFFAGIILTFLSKFSLKQKLTAILFFLFAFLTICPGFYFRQHYFISLLPAVGLLGGIALNYVAVQLTALMKVRSLGFLPSAVFVIALITIVNGKKEYYLNPDAETISRTYYGGNPFIESPVIADYIKEHSAENDKIAVLGSEPQIYFYADRHAATGHIYTYALMEKQSYNKKMQQEMIAEIESNKPEYLVFCAVATSWLQRPESPTLIFEWGSSYLQKYYKVVGIADIVSPYETKYKWDADAVNYQPVSGNFISVFKRSAAN